MLNRRARLLSTTVLALGAFTVFSPAARADGPGPVVVEGNAATGVAVLNSTEAATLQNTNNSHVVGPTLTVGNSNTQTVYTNFNTTGGTGAGGGAGLGGVFFVDTGATLALHNVSFVGNTATGGTGGGLTVYSVAPGAYQVFAQTALANPTQVVLPALSGVTIQNGQLYASGFTESFGSSGVAALEGVALFDNGPVVGTIKTVTSSGVDSNNLSLQEVKFVNSIPLGDASKGAGYSIPGNVFTSGLGYASIHLADSKYMTGDIQVGDSVYYGDSNNPSITTVESITYTPDGKHIATYDVKYGPDAILNAQEPVYTAHLNHLDVTPYAAGSTPHLTVDITPIAPLGGFQVGMTVTSKSGNIPVGTTVTAVDATTGAITLSNSIDTSSVLGISASFNPLISNSSSGAVVQLNSTAGLVVGQKVSGIGIPDNTTIAAINGNQITLSKPISNDGVTAIAAHREVITNQPVGAVDTQNKTVTLASTAGLIKGALLTDGGVSIPANAIIQSISGNTVTYAIDAAIAAEIKGGSMNKLLPAASNPLFDGTNGLTGANYGAFLEDGTGGDGGTAGSGQSGIGKGIAGSNGGAGGSGTNGLPYNAGLIADLVFSTATLGADFLTDVADAVDPFTIPAVPADIAHTVIDAASLALTVAKEITWQIYEQQGTVALGGSGGAGGNGAQGDTFFGGGAGGRGGTGGNGATPKTIGGQGGQGGQGGSAGFGAGGGQGGSFGIPGANGQFNSFGNSGLGGFGGGNGSTWVLNGNGDTPTIYGGGGGSGYGGAIFVRNGGTLLLTGNSLFQNNATYAGVSNNGGSAGQIAGTDMFIMKGSTVTLAPGAGNTITFNGSIADDSSASIGNASFASGQGASITIGGGGTVQLFGSDTFTGTTTITGATLEAQDGTGINANSHIEFAGAGKAGNLSSDNAGVLLSNGSFSRFVGTGSNAVSWTGSGGFAALAGGLTVNLGVAGGTLTWGSKSFVPAGSTLLFGSDAVDATGTVTFQNGIDLTAGAQHIAVYHNGGSTTDGIKTFDAVMSGNITNGDLIFNDAGYSGSLLLSGQNSLSTVTVNGGTLSTTDGTVVGRLTDPTKGGDLNINAGRVVLGGKELFGSIATKVDGSIVAAGPIIVHSLSNSGMATFGPASLDVGKLESSGVLVLLGKTHVTDSLIDAAVLSQMIKDKDYNIFKNSGSLVQMNDITVSGTTVRDINNSGTWLLESDISSTGAFNNSGNVTVVGNISGSPAVEGAATRTISTTSFVGTGTVVLGGQTGNVTNTLVINQSGDSHFYGVFTGAGSLVKNGAGTLDLGGASTFTGPLTINGGTIDTTPGGTLAAAVAVTVNSDGTFIVAANDTIASIQNFGATTINAVLRLQSLANGLPDPLTGSVTVNGTLNASGPVSNYLGTMTFAAGSTENLGGALYNGDGLNSQGTLAVTGQFTNENRGVALFGPAGSSAFGSLLNSSTLVASSSFAVAGNATNTSTGALTFNAGSAPKLGSLTNGGTINLNDTGTVTGAYIQNSERLTTGNNANLTTGSFSGVGGAVVLNGTSRFTINQASDGAYFGTVSGAGTVYKQGPATLTLAGGADSFAPSALTVHTGAVTVQNAAILDGALLAVVDSSGTLQLMADQSIASLVNNGVTNLSANLTTSGSVIDNGTLNVIGSGSPEVAGTRTITTTGFSGTGTTNLGGMSGTVANTLVIDQSGNSTFVGSFTGAGSLVKNGSGTLGLTGVSSFTGPLTINVGTIDTTGGGMLAAAVAVTVNAAGTFIAGTNDTIASIQTFGTTTINAALGLITLTNGMSGGTSGTVTVNGTLAASGAVANNLGSMTFASGSTETLSTTLYNADLLNVQSTLAVTGQFTNDTSGVALFGPAGSSTFGSLLNKGMLTAASPFTVIGNTSNTATGTMTLNGGASPLLGSLTNSGIINIADLTSVAGAYIQNAGSLTTSHGITLKTGSFSGTGGAVLLGDNATFVIDQTENGTYSGTVSGRAVVDKRGPATLTLAGAANSFIPLELIVFDGAVTVQNAGILGGLIGVDKRGALNLLANQTIASALSIGTLNLSADLTVLALLSDGKLENDGTLNIIGTGSPEVAATRTINTVGLIGSGVTNLGGVSGTVANTLVLNQSRTSRYSGTFTGAGNLVKTGAGTLIATGANTFTGTLTINGGAFNTTGGGTLADVVDVTVGKAGTYIISTDDTIHSVTNNGVTAAYAALTLATFANNATGTATITGAGTLTASGNVLNSGALNFGSGSTETIGGMLTNTGSGVISSQGALTVAGLFTNDTGATATLGSMGSDTFGNLINAGTITANANLAVMGNATNSGTLTLNGAGNTFGSLTNLTTGTINATGYIISAGAVSNSGAITVARLRGSSLTNTAGATLTDSGAALFSGAVSNGGAITTVGITGTTLANVAGATLTNSGVAIFSDAVVNAGTLATVGVSGATLTNSGTLTSTDLVSIAGAYIQNAGSLSVTRNLFTGSLSGTGGAINLGGASAFVIDQTAAGTFAGSIGGLGMVEKLGLATLTLSGPADSIATTTLNVMDGQLIVTQANALDRSLAVGVAAGATVTLQANQVFGQLNGSGAVNFGSNNLTLTDGGDYAGAALGSGTFTLNGGTFQAGGSITAGALAIAGGTFDLAGTATAATTTINGGATLQLGNGIASGTPGARGGTLNSPIVTIDGGATLSGNGTIAGNVTVGGSSTGTFAPGTRVALDIPAPMPAAGARLVHIFTVAPITGNRPGIISVANLTFNNMSAAAMTIDGKAGAGVAGGNSLVNISGNLVMNTGSTLAIEQSMPGPMLTLALGQRIQLFAFQPGHFSGYFGQVTASNFANNLIFDVPTGSVIALGNYTPAQFQAAVSQTPNEAALINALQVSTAGGVPQYYGGSLLTSVTNALATGTSGAVNAAFERFSPEAYTGVMDQIKQSVLDNQLDLSSYDTLKDGLTYAIGNINRNGMDGANVSGYAKNVFRDTAMQAGLAHQFSVAEVTLAFGHTDGSFHGNYLHATEVGSQALLGVSVPIGFGQKLRAIGQLTYGGYNSHGDRAAATGNTFFGGLNSHAFSYTVGLAYRSVGAVQIDLSAKAIGLNGHVEGFAESAGTGTSANALDLLTIAPINHQAWVGRFSAALGTSLARNLTGYVDVTYDRELGREYTAVTANVSAEAVRYTVENPGFGRNRALAGVGLKYDITPALRLHLDAKAGTNKAYDFGGGLRLSF